jgi:hypothetical protein
MLVSLRCTEYNTALSYLNSDEPSTPMGGSGGSLCVRKVLVSVCML